jgi:hypothetical protein
MANGPRLRSNLPASPNPPPVYETNCADGALWDATSSTRSSTLCPSAKLRCAPQVAQRPRRPPERRERRQPEQRAPQPRAGRGGRRGRGARRSSRGSSLVAAARRGSLELVVGPQRRGAGEQHSVARASAPLAWARAGPRRQPAGGQAAAHGPPAGGATGARVAGREE